MRRACDGSVDGTGSFLAGLQTTLRAGAPRQPSLSARDARGFGWRSTFEFRAEMLNAFNHTNFTPVISTSNNADNYRVTGVEENSSRIIQLVFRLNW